MKISDIGGEFELIKRISKDSEIFSKDVIHGIGDDTAVLEYSREEYLLITTDMIVEDDHFSLDYFTPRQIGIKAIESNVSDIASMGGFPKHALISLALSDKVTAEFIEELYKGFNEVCKKYKISIIGGDTTHSDKVVVNITLTGIVEKKNLCLRSDAKVDDVICVSGDLGGSTAGLNLFLEKKKGKSTKPHLEPKARLGLARKIAGFVNAMEDVSDGLAQETRNICNASKTGAVIFKEKIPISEDTFKDAEKVNKDAYDFALYGGEDFELVFTINKKNLEELKKKINKFYVVGKILNKTEGVYLLDKDRKIKLGKGFDHFK